jgi:DNA-binding LacI/PurR family transcriptional regulator
MVAVVDVAKAAGVSPATVSRVLNNHPLVRPETRERVEAAMQALGYRLSVAARAMRTSETRLVLALAPNLTRGFFGEVLRGITKTAHENDYEVLLCETMGVAEHERAFTRMLNSHRYDGVISMSPLDTERLTSAEMQAVPGVACLETAPDTSIPHVSIDDRQAARDAVLYLLSKGHRRIAMILTDEHGLYSKLRRAGYSDALRGAGITEREDYLQHVDAIDVGLGELATRRLLALDERPTAIFAVSDELAIGALKVALAAKLDVPSELAVIGFDDGPIAAMFEPPLTTVRQPMRELGEHAMRLLLRRLKGEEPASITLPHSLIERRSA